MRLATILLLILCTACAVVPREGKTPEVVIYIADDYCDNVKMKTSGRGVTLNCTKHFQEVDE